MSEKEHFEASESMNPQAVGKVPRAKKLSPLWLVLLAILFLGIYCFTRFAPASSRHHKTVVEVPESLSEAGAVLQKKAIIRSAWAFELYAWTHGENKGLTPGRYTLSPNMSLGQILTSLKSGPGHSREDIVSVTIPEGFTLKQIASRLEKEGITEEQTFLDIAQNSRRLSDWNFEFPRPESTLEGYLFPDTYEFSPNTKPEKVLDVMLSNFSRRYVRPNRKEIAASGHTVHELVTIGSLIEREAEVSQDRARIAGVLENRLHKGMQLEIDATVLYALGHHKSRVLFKDLKVDSPYNTYRHKGLPPGPIANPGIESMMAALRPEKNDFYFYVASPSGAHIFTRSITEHNTAIKQLKSERRASGGSEDVPGG